MTITVLGCGWLGFPLAQRLAGRNYRVMGSARSEKKVKLLNQNSIDGYRIELPDSFQDESAEPFWNSEILFLNIPPSGTGNPESYPGLMERAVRTFMESGDQENKWVIFVSSTSVYSDTGGLTREEDVVSETLAGLRGQMMLRAELAVRRVQKEATILRFGGLYGYGRHPIYSLSGRTGLKDPQKPVHLIHQKDCLNIITKVVEKQLKGETYNLISDGHPPKKTFYQHAAKFYNLPLPQFLDEPEKDYRILSNRKIKEQLGYTFTYPNPMDLTP